MCGIVGGLSGSNVGELKNSLQSMTNAILHRGPDDCGSWVDECSGVVMGHRRLSILDVSPQGHQPMFSPCGRYVVVFNGEIYNHLALREVLERTMTEHRWRGRSDTETLIACVVAWGIHKTLQSMVGMFAIALWDCRDRTLTLARDRFGEKPLYYGWQGDTFLFGSELKALRAYSGFDSKINTDAVALLLRYSYIPSPWSIWKNIYKVPAGTYFTVSIRQRECVPICYWSLNEVVAAAGSNRFQGSENEAALELDRLLSLAVKGQMLSDVPLGALLSGGIDSSMIVAMMQAQSPKPIRTFSIGFSEKHYDESRHAAQIAKHLGTSHTELMMTPSDVLDAVPRMPTLYDEPFADSSQLPTALVMALARRHVTVALTGDGGDEVFGGYNRYFVAPQIWKYLQVIPVSLRKVFADWLTVLPAPMWSSFALPLRRWHNQANVGDKIHKLADRIRHAGSIDELYLALVTEWQDAEQHVVGANIAPTLLSARRDWPAAGDPIERMMALDTLTYMQDDILVKVDRAAMGASLETRAPFLDHRLVEFAWRLPLSYKVRDGKGKIVLRRLLHRYVPKGLVERPKVGFGVPLNDWLRRELRDWAEDLLAPAALADTGLLNPKVIRNCWAEHLSGRRGYGYRMWPILMLQAWLLKRGA